MGDYKENREEWQTRVIKWRPIALLLLIYHFFYHSSAKMQVHFTFRLIFHHFFTHLPITPGLCRLGRGVSLPFTPGRQHLGESVSQLGRKQGVDGRQ